MGTNTILQAAAAAPGEDFDGLAAAWRAGDTAASARLLPVLEPRVRRLARDILRDDHLAEDAVQEALLAVHTQISGYQVGRPFLGWALAIAARKAIDQDRKRRRRWRHLQSLVGRRAPTPPPAAAVEAGARAREVRAIVDELLAELSPQQRRAFVLRDLQSLPLAECAEILELSLGATKAHVSFARRRLRELFAQRHPAYLEDPRP